MFWHTLALALGMSVRRAQEEIDEEEFRWWIVYNKISPIGKDRMDFGFAQVCSMIYNVNRGNQKALSPADFMPKYATKKQQMTPDQMKMAMRSLNNGSRRRS